MVELLPTAVTDAVASQLLSDYFAERARDFPAASGPYRTPTPDPTAFVPPNGVFLVARDGSEALGCGGVRRIEDDADGAVRYEVKHLWVNPSGRGRGLGRTLLAALETSAIGFGATRIVLDTNASLIPAAGLYSSSGYRAVPAYNDNPNATNWYAKDVAQTG